MNLNKYIDHTNLNQKAQLKDIQTLCSEAKEHNFATVCVNSSWVKTCADLLKDTEIEVCSVIGFPLGAMDSKSKVFEAKEAIAAGADEIDMVINVGKLLDQDYDYVYQEIKDIKEAIGNKVLKVIFETCLLNEEQIRKATQLSIKAKADFVKTSTGFSTSGASVEAVKAMIDEGKDQIKVKASGGIRSQEDCQKYIDLGVKRIGTSSGTNY